MEITVYEREHNDKLYVSELQKNKNLSRKKSLVFHVGRARQKK